MIRFSPVKKCIYCLRTDIELGDEHVIPFGLGGKFLLPSASCKKHEKITGKFEGVALRTIYGNFRMRNNLPTRRRKQRPATIKIRTNSGQRISIPVSEIPDPYFVYNFGQCGYLANLPEHVDVSQGNLSTIHNTAEIEEFSKKYDWDKKVTMRYMPDEFRRMILKIGYGLSVGVLGFKNIKYICTPYILGDITNISYLVGQNSLQEKFLSDRQHDVRIGFKSQLTHIDIISEIRLFAAMGTPTYHAVVGRIEHPVNFIKIVQNALKIEGVEVKWGSPNSLPDGTVFVI